MNATSDPTVRQLRALKAVADAGGYRRAAARLGVGQASLSAQIDGLEKTLGLRLMERGRAGAHLTPAGRDILESANAVLAALASLKDAAERLDPRADVTIRLGSSPTIGPYLLPRVAAALRRSQSGLKLRVREAAPPDLAQQLADGRHDAVLAQTPLQGVSFVTVELFAEPLLLVVSDQHRLSAGEAVRPEDLAGETVLSIDARHGLHLQVATLCDAFGAAFDRSYEGQSLDALRLMAAAGAGVAFLPASYVRSEIRDGGGVRALPIKGRRVSRSIGLVRRAATPAGAALETLIDAIRSVAG